MDRRIRRSSSNPERSPRPRPNAVARPRGHASLRLPARDQMAVGLVAGPDPTDGAVAPDGSFDAVATYKTTGRETPGLVEGEHRVRFEPPTGDDQDMRRAMKQFPRRYKSYEASGLKVTIPAPGTR